jgi:RHH-type proline utilization regulon transcriptional repressor/proline dehydrogenase/delta 1-pyrroline-5-carboxylate dehydrogenase
VYVDEASGLRNVLKDIPASVAARTIWTNNWETDAPFAGALVEGDAERIVEINKKLATLSGPLVLTQAASTEELAINPDVYCLNWLLEEVSTSINTTAAGGNASLMAIG